MGKEAMWAVMGLLEWDKQERTPGAGGVLGQVGSSPSRGSDCGRGF